MRIADFLRASFVGALMFTPAMADDIEKVHEEALRVLRQKLGQANEDLPASSVPPGTAIVHAPGLSADPEMQRIRQEREARIKAEAERRIAERERLQAERRQQFESYVKQRELLRERQKAYDENAARLTGQVRNSSEDEVHGRALAVLHKIEANQAASATPPATATLPLAQSQTSAMAASAALSPGSTTAAVSAEPASSDVTQRALQIVRERKMAAASASASSVPSAPVQVAQAEADAVHAQALEALHQLENQKQPAPAVKAPPAKTPAPVVTTRSPSSTTSNAPSNSPQPSPELQKRLKQMQLELEQEQMQKNSKQPQAQSPFPDGYIQDLEARAKQSVQQGPMSTPVPGTPALGVRSAPAAGGTGLDPATREMIRRQNDEIARNMGSNASTASAPKTTSAPKNGIGNQSAPSAGATSKAAPAQVSTPNSTAETSAASKPTGPKVAQRIESDTTNVQYSKDLEERARQVLAERAQNQQSGTMQAPAAPAATSPVTSAPGPVATPPSAPVAAAPVAPSAPTISSPAAPSASPAPAAAVNAAVQASAQAPVAAPANDVHTQALDTLNQIQSGAATAPKNKQQRLKELTDLYRADKMGPAEYHQKRAQIIAEPQ